MYFNFNDKQIYYETHGEGKPIILLNGVMMSTISWVPFIPSMSQDNQLILVDFLDQGKSDRMSQPYTQDLQVEVLRALLDHLNLDKASIMGISYGGEVLLKFAIKYGDRVDRLLLFNTTAKTSNWLRDIGRGWNNIGQTLDGQTYYNITIPVIYSSGFYQRESAWMNKREKVLVPLFSSKEFQARMKRLVDSAEQHDCQADLQKINNPTLIVTCMQDTLVPKVEQDYLALHIANAQYVAIMDSGHASMYEKPLLFTSLVLGFVNAKQAIFNI
ncbi:MAG: alpha/beta hydrolase [Clostridia bacterium]|nr:alpha/beta hydrolase [Clostridia bacterium]